MDDKNSNVRLQRIVLASGLAAILSLIVVMYIPPFTLMAHDQTSMLSVHLILEMFAIVVAMLVVTVSWHTFDIKKSGAASILIGGFIIVASCDLTHALTYAGMPPFLSESSTPRAIFFWLMGRSFEVLIMYALATNRIPSWSRRMSMFTGLGIAAFLIWFGSYRIDAFPLTFIKGQGVTQFKAYYEYVLFILYCGVTLLLWLQAKRSGQSKFYFMAMSSFVMGLGELAFTSYVAPSDFQVVFGHVYKVAAYALLYWTTFVMSIRAPFDIARDNEKRFRLMLETSPIAVRIAAASGQKTLFANQRYAELINTSRERVIGSNPRKFYRNPLEYDDILKQLDQGLPVTDKLVELKIPGGKACWAMASYYKLEYEGEHAVLGWLYDVTELKDAEGKIHKMAFYDALTQLPNRRLLMDRLNQALAGSSRNGVYGALLFIDLDHFKIINDTKGHDVGDLLLLEVANRLRTCVRASDTVSRLSGDEFLVVLDTASTNIEEAATQAEKIAEKIRSSLCEPYILKQRTSHISSSIGIVLFCGQSESAEDLLRYADTAMYQAKSGGRNTIRFYDAAMQQAIDARAELNDELHLALNEQQFHLHYQIQVDSSHRPVGAEVLLRWQHPRYGLVLPEKFIQLAEDTGLIIPIGMWVLQTACEQLAAWQRNDLTRHLTLAVNVSAKQFHETDFVSQVRQVLLQTGVNPSLLKLELTESTILDHVEDTIRKMLDLKKLGVNFSMDDFGTGYSSLQYLKRLPLDQLKIDQSFVRDLATNHSDKTIVRTIIAMAQSLDLAVIAEGVETEEQRALLLDSHCTHFQGYLFGKPMQVEGFESLLAQA